VVRLLDRNDERRPRREAAFNVNSNGDDLSLTALDDIARHVDGTFVVVVQTTGGRHRRRCFLTAASAERAAERALDRGENVTVYMAQLKPLWKLQGGRLDPEPKPVENPFADWQAHMEYCSPRCHPDGGAA
jgi:hypothetical protein